MLGETSPKGALSLLTQTKSNAPLSNDEEPCPSELVVVMGGSTLVVHPQTSMGYAPTTVFPASTSEGVDQMVSGVVARSMVSWLVLPKGGWEEPSAGEDLDVTRPARVMVEELPHLFQVWSMVSASDMLFDGLGWKGQGFKRVCVAFCQFAANDPERE
jgi:hypothetical protein